MADKTFEKLLAEVSDEDFVPYQLAGSMSIEQVYKWLGKIQNVSIYDKGRLAQPDEVANFRTGDGLEKAFLLANVIRDRDPAQDIEIITENNDVFLKGQKEYRFISTKGLIKRIRIDAAEILRIVE